jgi:hypothetical protein
MQATANDHEQENKQADNQSIVLQLPFHVSLTSFTLLRLRKSLARRFGRPAHAILVVLSAPEQSDYASSRCNSPPQ